MSNARTKQQIACDGVRAAWHGDVFTEILQNEVVNQFSMDGVVPTQSDAHVQPKKKTVNLSASTGLAHARQKLGKFIGSVDGVQSSWKQQTKAAT